MTDIVTGLTTEEVNKLKEQGLDNIPVGNQSKTIGQIIAGNVFTYFNFVFAVFAALLILVRSYINMTFLPIILLNTILGIVQEIKAKIVLDRLTVVNAPRTKVIRDSAVSEVDSVTLVKGDVCIFTAGNQLSADSILAEGCVRVNEAMVTGESDEVIKNKGDILLSGSYIVSGECKAVLTQVGHKAYAARLALEAKAGRKKKKTDMMKSLDNLVKIIGVVIVPLGIIMYVQSHFFLGHTIKNSVVSMVASLVGMIPEGLYLLASVALVVSVKKLARSNVLVHEMNCVETLARVNVLCVDKTGTITRPDMSVSDVVFLKDNVGKLIAGVAGNMDDDNETMKAIKDYYHITDRDNSAERVYSFSSQNKYSGAVLDGRCYIFGAPEYVLLDTYAEYEDIFERYSGHGERILVFGECVGDPCGNIIEEAVNPYAFIILENEIRDTAKETFGYFASQGVDIVVISGDNPVTASKVAVRAGINNAENYIDATTLKSRQDIREAITKYTVFGRVVPSQKKEIIEAYKESGKVVAMTGDGVNDVLALKCADCSVAMASGSEAASNAAQVVLLDSDFSKMPQVVLEGRRVVNNIQRSASLFLVKNIFSILTTIFTLIAANLYPLYPTQLSLLGAFTIGTPAFFLALQPNKNIIRGDFLTNVIIKALPAGITDFIMLAVISIHGAVIGMSNEQISTVAIIVLLIIGMMSLIRICRPFDWLRALVCIAMGVGIAICLLFFKKIFAIAAINMVMLNMIIVYAVVAVGLFVLMCRIVGTVIEYIEGHSRRFRKLLKG
ncbi:MAG: HAD-IC family P-type ATPase [Eubacterium sp.]|nr:HAD-IC family P-type ATPase [Eubacterium sp.]